MTPTKEQDAAIKRILEPYGFKEIHTEGFFDCMGSNPYCSLMRFAQGLDDFAKMLNISRSDIGLNGVFSLEFTRFDREPRVAGTQRYTGGKFIEETNTICPGTIARGCFAHEWGHAFDKAVGNVVLGKAPGTPFPDTIDEQYISSQMTFAFFSERFQNKCHEVGLTFAKEGKGVEVWYPGRPTEMFARSVEVMVSNRFIDEYVDLNSIAGDRRDPLKVLAEGGMAHSRAQHIQVDGLPLLNDVEQEMFEEKLDFMVEYFKELGLMHDYVPAREEEFEHSEKDAALIGEHNEEAFNDGSAYSDSSISKFLNVIFNRRICDIEEDEMYNLFKPFKDIYYTDYGEILRALKHEIEPTYTDMEEFKYLLTNDAKYLHLDEALLPALDDVLDDIDKKAEDLNASAEERPGDDRPRNDAEPDLP